jgi:Zn-dependent protease
VILAEPPPSQYDLHFALFGFPVRIHPMFWLSALLLGYALQDPIRVAIWVVAMVLCILLHELGHSVVMQAYGYCPSIVLYSFGGLAIPHPGRNGIRHPGPWGQMLISIAGPAAGFLLAAVLALGLHYLGGYPVMVFEPTWRDVVPVVFVPNGYLRVFLNLTFEITVNWGLLNLLPIYPLDGGQIAQQIFALTHPQDAMRQSLILSVIVGGMMSVVAFVEWQSFFMAVLFLWLTYSNFTALQSFRGGGRWY